jgi:hypothetical protein
VREGAVRAGLVAPPEGAPVFRTFTLACGLVLALGFALRGERYLSPERGVGYALGITGLALMALQLLYTLRKRSARLERLGRLKPWFQVHMVVGLLGPLAIGFHANFHVGAVNSRVALAAMLLVTASGLAGRFLYARVHAGLFGRRLELRWLQDELRSSQGALGPLLPEAPELAARLRAFEAHALARGHGWLEASRRFLGMGTRARRTRRACARLIRRASRLPLERSLAEGDVEAYLGALVRVARFEAYERLFAFWHVLHVPLCALLFGAAAIHVLAVHLY